MDHNAAVVSLFLLAAFFIFPEVRGQNAKKVSCKDAAGKPVDWFVVYKLPKTKNVNGYMSLGGGEMAYIDSGTKKSLWILLSSDIYVPKFNPVKETLSLLYSVKSQTCGTFISHSCDLKSDENVPYVAPAEKEKNVAYAAYNDQLPVRFKGTRGGHSKGILMAGKDGMVWLQHSVPRFVENVTEGYAFPGSGRENGQLFLCISMHLPYVEFIAEHLQVQAANVYQSHAPTWTLQYSQFWNILTKKYSRAHKSLKIDILKTARGKPVLAIAKPPNYSKDIYTEELNNRMNDSIIVQSWQNGAGGAQDMLCSKNYSVNDVDMIEVRMKTGNAKFSSKEDHSKWYVTRHRGIFCFSSLNRMLSQKKRGGEITCLFEPSLAELFRRSVALRSRCKNDKGE